MVVYLCDLCGAHLCRAENTVGLFQEEDAVGGQIIQQGGRRVQVRQVEGDVVERLARPQGLQIALPAGAGVVIQADGVERLERGGRGWSALRQCLTRRADEDRLHRVKRALRLVVEGAD